MRKFFRRLKFIIISIGLIFVIVGTINFVNSLNSRFNGLPSSVEVNSGNTNTAKDNSSNKNYIDNTTNILFLDNKSDSMVVASVDTTNKDIKFIPVANTGYFDRSNMDNLLNNIEKSVDMNLDKFLEIDTSKLTDVISLLGEFCVNIKAEDIKLINNLIPKFYAELDDKSKGDMQLIDSSGEQSINEYQAMAYITAISKDSTKQKDAIISVVKNIKDLGFTKYVEIYSKLKPYVATNLTITDLLKLTSKDYDFR